MRDQGLRRRGPRAAVVPLPGHHLQHRHAGRRRTTQAVVDAVNDIVAAEGGRVYLTKDASRGPSTTAPWIRASTASTRSAGAGIPRAGSERAFGAAARRRGVKRIASSAAPRASAVPSPAGSRRAAIAWPCSAARRGPRRERRRSRARAPRRGGGPVTALFDLSQPDTYGPALDEAASRSRRPRRGADHRRRLRHAGGARGRRGGARARALDQLHPHDPVLRGGARAPARGRRRHALRARVGRRRSRPQARRALWRDQGRPGVLPAGHRPALPRRRLRRCWSSRGSCAPA